MNKAQSSLTLPTVSVSVSVSVFVPQHRISVVNKKKKKKKKLPLRMLSRTSRKLSPLIHNSISTSQRRRFISSSSSRGNPFSRSVLSGVVVVVGSSFGLWYYSDDDAKKTRFLSLADAASHHSTSFPCAVADNSLIHESPKKSKFLFGDSYRRRVFFKYEKRMRMQSSPKKVFEYFASVRKDKNEVFMTPADLMRAVVPVFPPSESGRIREGSLRGEWKPGELYCDPSRFFMLFDTNNDGLISFPEYIFFVTLLSIPESSISVAFKMFDLNNNGEIDREEFKKVMTWMRSQNRQGARHRDGMRNGLKFRESVEDGGLVEYFFGKDGDKRLKHEIFVQFLRDFHDEILRLEFAHYDCKSCGTIPAEDFALSLVASADISHIDKFLDRVEEIKNEPNLSKIRITFEEFKNFAELRKKLQSLSFAIFSYGKINGLLTKKDFQRAASQVCGTTITNDLVDIIFHVFDTNRDGSLSSDEFVKVLQRRERDVSQTREAGLRGLLSCWKNCTSNCPSAKLLA